MFIASRGEKRKRDGKNFGPVWMHGQLIPEAKVRKETSRHVILSSQCLEGLGESKMPVAHGFSVKLLIDLPDPKTPDGIVVGTPRAEIEAIDYGATDWPQNESFDFATLGDIALAPSSYEGLTWQSDLQNLISSDSGLFSQSNELPAVFSTPENLAFDHRILSPILSPSPVTNDHEKSLSSDRMIEEGLQIILTQFDGDTSRGCGNLATALESVTTGTEDAFQSASSKNYSNYLQIYVYLASNNLLSEFSTRKLILLIAKTRSHSMLKVLLESKLL